jgi:hypothetical protein
VFLKASGIFWQLRFKIPREGIMKKEKFTVLVKKENAKGNATEYRFKTVKEIYDILNSENVDRFLEDFCVGVKSFVLLREATQAMAGKENIELEELTWIDD